MAVRAALSMDGRDKPGHDDLLKNNALKERGAVYGARRYPPASVISRRAWPGSGSIFCRRR